MKLFFSIFQKNITKSKTLLALLSISLISTTIFYLAPTKFKKGTIKPTYFTVPKNMNNEVLISHGGNLTKIPFGYYSNSYEALLEAVNNGYKFIEVDMILSKDGLIFGAHDWQYFNKITGNPENEDLILTANDLKKRKIFNDYNVLFAEDINQVFTKNPSLYLVTDKLTDFDTILEQLNFPNIKDRLLVEVFSYQEYVLALEKGIKYPMLCLVSKKRFKREMKNIKKGHITMITVGQETLSDVPDLFAEAYDLGVTIFVYTENNLANMQKHFHSRVTGFYTDTVTPASLERNKTQD